ncbi:MAG: hypothetical protein AAF656_11995 [Planctomycetota bacterium]
MSSPRRVRWLSGLAAVLLSMTLAAPALAQRGAAQKAMEEAEELDVRLQGYDDGPIVLEESSYALTYAVAVGLTLVCVGVMFKNAKRTHLD